jgi:hypothetical protein
VIPNTQWEQVAARLSAAAKEHGLMESPRVDWETQRLVEGELKLDMLNVFHHSRQLESADTESIIQSWALPKTITEACAFGRIDNVRARLAAGGLAYEEDVIAAATSAWVTTSLHCECVRALLEAGAVVELSHLRLDADSVGNEADFDMLAQLVVAGQSSDDAFVREEAKQTDVEALRAMIEALR